MKSPQHFKCQGCKQLNLETAYILMTRLNMSRLIRIYTVCHLLFVFLNMIQLAKTIIAFFADVNFDVCFLALKELKTSILYPVSLAVLWSCLCHYLMLDRLFF